MFEEHLLRNFTGQAEYEKERNKLISKKRYIVEQYLGISHLYDGAKRARFTTIIKNTIDIMCKQFYPVKFEDYLTGVAFNLKRGGKLLGVT